MKFILCSILTQPSIVDRPKQLQRLVGKAWDSLESIHHQANINLEKSLLVHDLFLINLIYVRNTKTNKMPLIRLQMQNKITKVL